MRKGRYAISIQDYVSILRKQGKTVPSEFSPQSKKENKYSARKVHLHGFVFDSKIEAGRYMELRYMLCAGLISDLYVHTRFPLLMPTIREDKIVSYRITFYEDDFDYVDIKKKLWVVEDVKSEFTVNLPTYKEKKLRMVEQYEIEINEIIR